MHELARVGVGDREDRLDVVEVGATDEVFVGDGHDSYPLGDTRSDGRMAGRTNALT